MSSGIVHMDSHSGGGLGGALDKMGRGTTALGLLVVSIILLVVGMVLISQENTSAGYPVLITGVLTGGLGGYLMYSTRSKKNNEKNSDDDGDEDNDDEQ